MAQETMQGVLQEQETAIGTTNLTRAGESMTFCVHGPHPSVQFHRPNFVIFDKCFADIPGPAAPNR
jgi:hypothetical protein